MKRIVYFTSMIVLIYVLSSCATIAGGSKYNAHVQVPNHPNASIYYKNSEIGKGKAMIKVPRREAKSLSFIVKDNQMDDKTFNFNSNTVRGWALLGTIVTWTGLYGGIPLPWGLVVDLATGALVKPNVNEKGISKIDYKNFSYTLEVDK